MTDFGVLIFATDYSITPANLAQAAEARGFESLFVPEHTHIPASRLTPWPGGRDLPTEYWHTQDPFVGLATAAAVTDSIKLGTGIALITERDPILMAKQVATLDFLSNGRVLLGVGAGWNVEEMANHGVAFGERWSVLRERVLAMQQIWTQEEAEYHGEHVDFDPIWSYPKPVQPGGPKILLGASSRWTLLSRSRVRAMRQASSPRALRITGMFTSNGTPLVRTRWTVGLGGFVLSMSVRKPTP